MRNYLLFVLMLLFVFTGKTLAQNTEGAARMEITSGEGFVNHTNQKMSSEKTSLPAPMKFL
ncbi:MAG: hypothetical protein RMJ97_07335 [Raineya sp.]|nr:hypothetical protein [Raineya sp.]MDW8296683.1 hypothetical protein [Raineya sp.]